MIGDGGCLLSCSSFGSFESTKERVMFRGNAGEIGEEGRVFRMSVKAWVGGGGV